MGRSSRPFKLIKVSAVALGLALAPVSGFAQVYGFPSDVGVIDDGYGTLPPEPTLPPPPFLPAPFGFPVVNSGPSPIAVRPTPPCPLIIRVGRGLRHAAHTRVTSFGRHSCS